MIYMSEDETISVNERLIRKVKPFGSGNSGHITIPQTLAKVGDRVLVINLDIEVDEKEDTDENEVIERKCQRCEFEWKGKRKNKPDTCPDCGLVPWDSDRKVPIWKHGGIKVVEKTRIEPKD